MKMGFVISFSIDKQSIYLYNKENNKTLTGRENLFSKRERNRLFRAENFVGLNSFQAIPELCSDELCRFAGVNGFKWCFMRKLGGTAVGFICRLSYRPYF